MITCTVCKKIVKREKHSTGYAVNDKNEKICYSCCADIDRAWMETHDRIALYLVEKHDGNKLTFQVTNWPGTLAFPVTGHKTGRHNWAGSRQDVWFKDHVGRVWWGVQYGGWSQLVHCRKLKGN